MCKRCEAFSLQVLIGRGLILIFRMVSFQYVSLFNFERIDDCILQPLSPLVGVYCGEGPPVPIPNTVVKLFGADDS